MNNLTKRILTSICLILIILLSLQNSSILLIVLILVNILSLTELTYLFKKIFKRNNLLIFFSLLVSFFYIILFSLIIWTYLIPHDSINNISFIFLLLICASTDIGGYILGNIIGGKKLTKISPNKTYSGAVGSLSFSLIFGYLFLIYQNNFLDPKVNIAFLIIIISITSQVGDLMISFLKRKAKIKDMSSVLPGHGGLLDRIDGILLSIPLGIFLI